MSVTALVLGAAEPVGTALVNLLQRNGQYTDITCLVERPLAYQHFASRDSVTPVVVDFNFLQDYQGYFNVDYVYCCLDVSSAQRQDLKAVRRQVFEYIHVAAQLARAQRCRGFVWLSEVGADAHSADPVLKVKGELENAIMTMPQLPNASAVRAPRLLATADSTLQQPSTNWLHQLTAAVPRLFKKEVSPYQVAAKMIELQHQH